MTETVIARNANLADLAELLKGQQARKLDLIVPTDKLRMQGGVLVLKGTEAELTEDGVTPTEGRYLPTAVFDEGVADKLGIPVSYLRRLRAEAPDLYDANVNGWLHGRRMNRGGEVEVVRPADDRKFMVRAFRGDGGEGVARALLSDGYKRMDNFDVLTAVLDGVRQSGADAQVAGCDLTDRRMYVDVIAPGVQALAPVLLGDYKSPFDNAAIAGQRVRGHDVDFWRGVAAQEGMGYEKGAEPVVFAGFRVSNSEVGNGRFTITPKLVVKICRNGLTITADALGHTHLGGKLEEGIVQWSDEAQAAQLRLITVKARDAVRTFLDVKYVARKVAEIEARAGKPIAAPETEIHKLGKALGFTAAETEGVMAHFIMGGQMTAGGVVNAVTSYSQTIGNADRADAMDAAALKVLQLA